MVYNDPQSDIDFSASSIGIDIAEGYTATAYASPYKHEDYVFVGWYEEGTKLVSTASYYSFEAYNDFSLTAKFAKQSLIVLRCSEGGKVAFDKTTKTSIKALPGDSVTVIATSDEGYGFIGWYTKTDDEEHLNDGSEDKPSETIVSTDNIYTFEVSEDVELFAKFAKKVVVTLDVLGNGEACFDNSSEKSLEFFPGDSVTVIATPEEGYYFNYWSSAIGESCDSIYSFVVPFDMVVTAVFGKIPTVSIACTEDGSVAFENSSETSMAILPGTDITVIASPNEGVGFKGWFIVNDWYESLASTDATYTFTVSEDISLIAKFYKLPEMVDLGLSVKWANYNVGATSPEEYGGYYAWGEIEEKGYYDFGCYKWCYGSSDFMTKYCVNSNNGTVDGKYVLESEDDVASVAWGGDWRMPTSAEQRELREKCSWEWTTFNGVNGHKVTGPNGNSIFMPATGFKSWDSYYNYNDCGSYWSSTVCGFYTNHAYSLYISESGNSCFRDTRNYGFSVRPVSGEPTTKVIIVENKGSGSIEINGAINNTGLCKKGEAVTITAIPDYGYEFVGWFVVDNPTPISTDITYTFTANDNMELIAEFEKLAVVSISSNGNGSVSFENSTETTMIVKPGTSITVIACPEEGYDFMGWHVDGVLISNKNKYTFTVEKDITLVAEFMEQEDGVVNLGLPSGTKWGTCNVGATSPEEYGGYYAWAEVVEKNNYSWNNYQYHRWEGNTRIMTKYSAKRVFGYGDGKEILDSYDDVAHVTCGDGWRMPTSMEMVELRTKCTWEWTTLNDINGYKVTGPNGNSIFLPAAGYRSESNTYSLGEGVYYWVNSRDLYDEYTALYSDGNLHRNDGGEYCLENEERYKGFSVRPVRD